MIGVCLKAVDLHVTVDPLTGDVRQDPEGPRGAGLSAADEAALEWALRLGEAWDCPVAAVAAGGRGCEPEQVLRAALAAGASCAVRVAVEPDAPSACVAGLLAQVLGEVGAGAILCGDASLDRGSGSVPAFLAGELRAAQALGIVGLSVEPVGRSLLVDRRLDRGRRERLRVREPFVVSVEATTARLRRASVPSLLAADSAAVDLVEAAEPTPAEPMPAEPTPAEPTPGSPRGPGAAAVTIVGVEPFRPRARVVPPPPASLSPRERVMALTGVLRGRQPPRTLSLGPDEAAAAVLEALRGWGEL